jgi:hypothetical protein
MRFSIAMKRIHADRFYEFHICRNKRCETVISERYFAVPFVAMFLNFPILSF